jgi:enoyl-CoA hydratase
MLYTGRPLLAADALTLGLVSAVTPDAELDAYGLALAADMLKAQPDALRLSKRSFDATLEGMSFDAALELEERAQMLMIARRAPRGD